MKKIIMMAKALGGGGAEVAMIELLNQLDYTKYQVKLVLLDDDEEYKYRLKHDIEIEHIRFRNESSRRKVSMYSFEAKVIKKLAVNSFFPVYDKLLDDVENTFDEEYDIALDFYGYGYFLTGFMAKKIKAKKKATWLHDEKMGWMKNSVRYLDEYDKVFAVSEAVADSFKKNFPDYKRKVNVFYNVINIDAIIDKSKDVHPSDFIGSFKILTVGRLTEQKGHDIAIKAAKILKDRGVNFNWYVIGDGRDEKKLKSLIERLELNECFKLLGRRDNPYTYMSACDLYVQPSRHEGYVITLVEARALCVPIVSSDIPSSVEQIKNGVNGYTSSLNAESLAECIERLYKNPQMREKTVEYLLNNKIDFSKEIEKIDNI